MTRTPTPPRPAVPKILICDDRPDIREALKRFLENQFDLILVDKTAAALDILSHQPDIRLALVHAGLNSAANTPLPEIKKLFPGIKTILVATSHTRTSPALEAQADSCLAVPLTEKIVCQEVRRLTAPDTRG